MLSRHLARHEIACKCGCGYGLKDFDFSPITVLAFEKIRVEVSKFIGTDTPIEVSSGCRCIEHNRNIGGAPHSRHMKGDALDLVKPVGIDYDDFYEVCDSVIGDKGGVGYYLGNSFIHIDTRGVKRRWTH